MKTNNGLLILALAALFLFSSGATASSAADQAYDEGHAALNKAWDMEAQSIRMGYSSNARMTYLERAKEAKLEALSHFDRAISEAPQHYQAHSIRGLVLRKLGRHEEALAAYEAALSINHEDLTTVEYRAEAYVELGRFEEAKNAYFHLVRTNVSLANDLLAFMKIWLERPYPAQQELLETDEYRRLLAWVEERMSISEKLAMLEPTGTSARW